MSVTGGMSPARLQVLRCRLEGIADEMSSVLRRAAFSPNMKERADCSSALFTPEGELLAQAENIPVHLGSMPASVRAAIEAFDGGAALDAADQVVLNDPFAGGTHLNDITLVAPCFANGRLAGWVANRAHHADVGGDAPGSMPAGARSIRQEGVRIPPTRFGPAVVEALLDGTRTPAERLGDLDAQLGANRVGAERLALFADEPVRELLEYGERRMRAALAALPDGTWRFDDTIDSFGPDDDQRLPTRLAVSVTIAGDAVTFDFEGSGPQRDGSVNAVEAVTVSSVVFALRSVVDPTIPANGGSLRPVNVIAPPGTIVNARPPAAVGAGNVEVSQRIADVCLGALSQVLPGSVGAASQGTMNNVLVGSRPGHEPAWVYYETIGGGQGGRPPRAGMGPPIAPTRAGRGTRGPDQGVPGQSGIHTCMTNTVDEGHLLGEPRPGQSGIHTCMTNTKNTPVEALERAFPLRVLRYRLRRGSGGAGWAAGGEGIERDLQVLVDVTLSLITERRVSQPWGLAGGEPGAVGENWFLPGADEARAERLPDKCTVQLRAGDVLRMLTPGGGGWGNSTV